MNENPPTGVTVDEGAAQAAAAADGALEEKVAQLVGGAVSVLLFIVMVVFAVGCGLLGWFQLG